MSAMVCETYSGDQGEVPVPFVSTPVRFQASVAE